MTKATPEDEAPAHEDDDSLETVYIGSGGRSPGVREWLHIHRSVKQLRKFYSFEEQEEDFLTAMRAGAEITKGQVCKK